MRRCRPQGVVESRTQVIDPFACGDRKLLRWRLVLYDPQNEDAPAFVDQIDGVRMTVDVRVPELNHLLGEFRGTIQTGPRMSE